MTPKLVQIYNMAASHLGRHLTLDPSVSEEVGCAESVSWILRNCALPIPNGGLKSVNDLIAWMLANGFKEVPTPQEGAVVTAHQPVKTNPNYAHTGICGTTHIMSNTSATGLFQANYTPTSWATYFGRNGSVTRYFVPC